MEEIVKIIISMSGSYSPSIIFDDWIKLMALTLANNPHIFEDETWEYREQQYLDTIKKYNESEIEKFTYMYAILIKLFESKICDYLGEIYMKCEMGNGRLGQFFTPFHLSELTSKIVGLKTNESGIYEVYEPTCGGGGMILAYAKYLQDEGINYQKKMRVVAQDLDWRGVYMTYVQCSILGIKAKVCQGDTLAEPIVKERHRIFYTPTWRIL